MLSAERKEYLEHLSGQCTNDYDAFENEELTSEDIEYIDKLDRDYAAAVEKLLSEIARLENEKK